MKRLSPQGPFPEPWLVRQTRIQKSSEALLALEAASKLVAMIWASVLQQRCAL
ncbi:hypothetical protein C7S17_4807 [Burkholderia thailandensis]|nr:hypothetical protein [Burkholderia thailandensis]